MENNISKKNVFFPFVCCFFQMIPMDTKNAMLQHHGHSFDCIPLIGAFSVEKRKQPYYHGQTVNYQGT
jgi:hypothetical protein